MNRIVARQRTIRREVRREGIGLHSGARVSIHLKPASPNFGIRFRRIDMADCPHLIANYQHVVDTSLATTIGFNGTVISTIEHLMAALLGNSVDNVLVELNGPEVPIFDGSASPFIELIERAGIEEQEFPRRFLHIKKPIALQEGDAYIKVHPSNQFKISYAIDFPHPLIGKQKLTWCFSETAFARDIAKARTFGFLRDVNRLQSMGLAQGGSLENAIVFDDYGLLNSDGLRYADECVRHKVLDLLGDLALAGMPLIGHFDIYKAGHTLHNRFLWHLMTKPSSYAVSVPPYIKSPFFQSPSFSPVAEPVSLASKSM